MQEVEAWLLCCLPSCSLLAADIWQSFLACLHFFIMRVDYFFCLCFLIILVPYDSMILAERPQLVHYYDDHSTHHY